MRGSLDPGRVNTIYWGWMWQYGPSELVRVECHLTGEQYGYILEDIFLPFVRAMAILASDIIRLVQDKSHPLEEARKGVVSRIS